MGRTHKHCYMLAVSGAVGQLMDNLERLLNQFRVLSVGGISVGEVLVGCDLRICPMGFGTLDFQ